MTEPRESDVFAARTMAFFAVHMLDQILELIAHKIRSGRVTINTSLERGRVDQIPKSLEGGIRCFVDVPDGQAKSFAMVTGNAVF